MIEYKRYRLDEINYPNGYKEMVFLEDINNKGDRNGGRKGNKNKDVSIEMKQSKVYKNKKQIRRLCILNDLTRMMTLTTKENIEDHNKGDKLVKLFMMELKRIYPQAKDIKYIASRERQNRGAIHYHFGINMYIPQNIAEKVWLKLVNEGTVNLVYKGIKAINYLAKYIEKNMLDDEFIGKDGFSSKAYLCSKNLDRDINKYKKSYSYIIIRDKKENKTISNGEFIEIVKMEIEELKEKGKIIYDNITEYVIKGDLKQCRSVLILP